MEIEKRISQTQPAQPRPALRVWKGMSTMLIAHKRISLTAAVLLIAAGVIVAFHVFPIGENLPSFTSVSFAEVQKQVRNLETMSCIMNMTMQTPPDKTQSVTMKIFMKEQGLLRQEFVKSSVPGFGGYYTVINMHTGKIVSIVPAQKMAIVMDHGEFSPELMQEKKNNPWSNVREMIEGNATSLGEKTIDGNIVQGFDVTQDGQRMQIWVNDKAAPMEVCMEIPGINAKMTMSDFRFNEPMKDSLFSQDIPKDYKIQNMDVSLKNLSEKDLLEGLRMIAECNDNKFPEGIFSMSDYLATIQKVTKKKLQELKNEPKLTSKQIFTTIQSFSKTITRMLMFARTQQKAGQFEYFGGGVKLGDAKKVIVLYRSADSPNLRMIFGDLMVKEVPATIEK
ncbi:MAG: hypothetical protein JXA11_02080 [Phycisphaerae bacterium]|nr:hypothetical protein [Phycisphaerae bacterium]